MDFTCVEIKNVKYIKLLSLDQKGERELDLTTIHQDQELAYLNIYLIDKNKNKNKKLLKCIKIDNIHPGHSGIPELHLSVSYDGSRYYTIALKLNGYMYHNSIIDIRHFRKTGFKLINIALAALALIIISFLTFFAINTFSNKIPDRKLSDNSQQSSAVQGSTGQSTTGQSTTGQSTTGQSTTDQSTTDQSTTDQSTTDQSATDQSTTDQSTTDQSTTDQSTTDQSTTDQSTTDQSTTDQSTTDQSTIDQSTTDQSTIDQSTIDQSTTDQSTTDQSTTDQPIYASELVDDEAVVYFYPDSSFLTNDAKSVLDRVLDILKSGQSLYVEITGHCAYYGTEKGRQEISTERARSVYSYFVANGWTPEKSLRLEGLGLGQIVTKDPDKQNLNRRVEIVIKSNTED